MTSYEAIKGHRIWNPILRIFIAPYFHTHKQSVDVCVVVYIQAHQYSAMRPCRPLVYWKSIGNNVYYDGGWKFVRMNECGKNCDHAPRFQWYHTAIAVTSCLYSKHTTRLHACKLQYSTSHLLKWWLGINEYIWKLRVVLYSNFQRCVSKYISWLLKHQMLSVLSLITLSVSESQTTVANAYCNDIAFNIKKAEN